MAFIFATGRPKNGLVVVVNGEGTSRVGALQIPAFRNAGPLFGSKPFLINRISIAQRAVAQFQVSLEQVMYIYNFGEEVGRFDVSGVAFHRTCDGVSEFTGVTALMKVYEQYSLSNSSSPIKISIDTMTINAYLIGHQIETGDPMNMLTSFTMNMVFAPTKKRR